MSKDNDPYGTTKSLLVFSIIGNVIAFLMPVLGIPLFDSFSIMELMEGIPDTYELGVVIPGQLNVLAVIGLGASTLAFILAYVNIETENAKYYIIGGALLNLLPIFFITQLRGELNEYLEVNLVNYQLGYMALFAGVVFGAIAALSIPDEQDLAAQGQPQASQPSSVPVQQGYTQHSNPAPVQTSQPSTPTYEESSAPAKPLDSVQAPAAQPEAQPEKTHVFCGECGTRATSGTKFCGECGSQL